MLLAGLSMPRAETFLAIEKSMIVLQAPEDDKRVIWTYGDKLRVKPLPVLVAANGHVYFYQHLPEKCGCSCTSFAARRLLSYEVLFGRRFAGRYNVQCCTLSMPHVDAETVS